MHVDVHSKKTLRCKRNIKRRKKSAQTEFMPQFFKGHDNIRVWRIQILNPFKLLEAQSLNVASTFPGARNWLPHIGVYCNKEFGSFQYFLT